MFFRKATDSTPERRTSSRHAGSSEAQLKELRSKARRRLIGALALVLAAVIIVPPLFDAPPPEPIEPIIVPAISSGIVSMSDPEPVIDAEPPATPAESMTEAPSIPPSTPASPEAAPQSPATPPATTGQQATTAEPPSAPPAQTRAPAAPSSPPTPSNGRTDDGSVALALLAGKMPDAGAPAQPKAQGSFILQVAAYTTEQDARQRRDSLVESGVTNAYVERGQSGDKTVYRLRVGPFPTHEAAQAAQTRLRALGYQNGLISSK